MSLITDEGAAERLARAILADITLENDTKIRDARDLLEDMRAELDEGRTLFASRVDASLARVWDDELRVWQGRAKDRAQQLGGAGLDRSRLLIAVGAAAALTAVVAWLLLH